MSAKPVISLKEKSPHVRLAGLTPEQHLNAVSEIWDDALPTWKADRCPVAIDGIKTPAKYWLRVFPFTTSKQAHSAFRTQWHKWELLMNGLQNHGFSSKGFWATFRDSNTSFTLTIAGPNSNCVLAMSIDSEVLATRVLRPHVPIARLSPRMANWRRGMKYRVPTDITG
ncbi:hypothetical protein GYMLUDRAFT_778862 [Collybiopsis luxurians FD-317 M1]|uniref:Uncharacterized protein n=1 Tax=Collybiopsis luxurians FD-317 M1 TaxID=944289 RepID=A0A0D0B0K8_9AGAR|nr:hypothetical protein GYMLUDRAFT_778862 [Collybiopsis luxurians FD-317 M1]